jgi:amidohydrolase
MLINKDVMALLNDCIEIRQSLHRIPELGFEEEKTSAFIRKELEKYPPDSIEILAGTGIKAVYYAKNPTKTIAFRADMDALKIEELNNVPYKSEHEGKMHACGHDGHVTMLLLTAQLIHKYRDKLTMNIVLIFQPAEEGKGGANRMIADGVLKNPDIDSIYGMHLWPDVPKGKVGIRWGPMMAKTCEFDVTIHGKSSHGARPQDGVDAVVVAAQFITMLQTAITRSVDPHSDAVLTIGKITGGMARNIIADKVVMQSTMRVLSQETYDLLMNRMRAMMDGIAVATESKFEIKEWQHFPCVDNPRHLVEEFYNCLDGMSDTVIVPPVMAAEDFSCYQLEIPGIFMFIGIGGGKNCAALHNGRFDFDEDAMLYGVDIYRRLLGI